MNFDVFESQEFAPTTGGAPFAQIFNPDDNGGAWGFALTEKNAIAGGVAVPGTWEKVDREFRSGDVETIYVTKKPRLLILGGSALIMRDRTTRTPIAKFDFKTYNKTQHSLYRRVWCYIINQEGNFCHLDPLAISIGGASGASFMSTWFKAKPRSGFVDEMESLYAAAVKKPKSSKGELFHAHCIYEPILNLEKRGVPPTASKVTITSGYNKPTLQNLVTEESQRAVIKDSFQLVKVLAADFENRVFKQEGSTDVESHDQPW